MGVIRPPRQAVLPSSGRSSDTSGAATPATQPNTDTESVASSGAATPRLVPATAAHPGVCPVQVRRNLGTHSFHMKQGRRTKQRLENEKMLMSMYGIDEEDALGTAIPHQTRSYFMDLVARDNEELLDQFINNQEPMYFSKQRSGPRRQVSRVDESNFEPEDAFMKISSNLRQALKKHPPMGMLEGLEEQLTARFSSNPQSEFVAEDLSSFERLLVHALASYNSLNSHSFDFAGKRLVRVENPAPSFFKRDPGLTAYLAARAASCKPAQCAASSRQE